MRVERTGLWIAKALAVLTLPSVASCAGSSSHAASSTEPALPTLVRDAEGVRATLSYKSDDEHLAPAEIITDELSISRNGKMLLREILPGDESFRHALSHKGDLSVRDLDGDGQFEVMIGLHSYYPHCCSWTVVYRFDSSRQSYVGVRHWWGNSSATPDIRDLDGDGRPEFVSEDDRFADRFSGYAGSIRPIRIWSYRGGRFADVTRRYPTLIAREARGFLPYVKYRPFLAAWAADEYMLGRAKLVQKTIERLAKRAVPAGATPELRPPTPDFVAELMSFLRQTGYVPKNRTMAAG
jgi:hypothetical protein